MISWRGGFGIHTMPRTIHFVYISRAVQSFATPELAELAEKSAINNAERGITGVLLYGNGRFMQLLEGSSSAIEDLYLHKILLDERHTECQVLLNTPCRERLFPDWSMGKMMIPQGADSSAYWDALCSEIAKQNPQAVFAREPANGLIHSFMDELSICEA